MSFESWSAFYQSELQGVWLLLPVPAIFLVYLLSSRRARELAASSAEARFVRSWALLFAVETMLDPLVGSKLPALFGVAPPLATAALLTFVLLGDFRVYWLVFAVALANVRRGAWLAAAATPVVPLLAYAGDHLAARFWEDATGQRLWVIHELLFTAVAVWLWAEWLPSRVADAERLRFLRRVCAYVIVYYALWAVSDMLWLAFERDPVWLLRVVPNQLYYAFFVPFVWFVYSRRG